MIMFDNALFATFIPQILMSLGFLSCVTAPLLSFFHEHKSADVIKIDFDKTNCFIDASQDSSDESTTCYFFLQTEDCFADISVSTDYFPEINEINYGPFNHVECRLDTCFSLFSRPPPIVVA